MDISSILDQNGNKIFPQFLRAAESGNIVFINGIWPHPVTDELSNLSVWCGMLDDNDVICSLAWSDKTEEDK